MSTIDLESTAGLRFKIRSHGAIARIDHDDVTINTYLGSEVAGGPANVYLRFVDRRMDGALPHTPLLGPRSPGTVRVDADGLVACGAWEGVEYRLTLRLATSEPAWFWHVALRNVGSAPVRVDLVHVQDVSLAHYGAIRNNEYYVSQYVDFTPLVHDTRGYVLAMRQNLSMGGRHPWAVMGALDHGTAFATDALQLGDLGSDRLESRRRQHEHGMAMIQGEPLALEAGESGDRGFFAAFTPSHDATSGPEDLACVDRVLGLPEATSPSRPTDARTGGRAVASLFSRAPLLVGEDLTEAEVTVLFGVDRRCEERRDGRMFSFFTGADRHVVLGAKERAVLRPHGHILRTGAALVPDEASLSTTAWMRGVFNSLLTQGHTNINRFISATHGYRDLSGVPRADGQRVFVEHDGGYRLLDTPSAFEMTPAACRWVYKYAGGRIEVRVSAGLDRHVIDLELDVCKGAPRRFLVSTRVALNGDDGATGAAVRIESVDRCVVVRPQPDSEIGQRFPDGFFRIEAREETRVERVGGDDLLFVDGSARGEPYVTIVTAPAKRVVLRIVGRLTENDAPASTPAVPTVADEVRAEQFWREISGPLTFTPATGSSIAADLGRLREIVPWYAHNALVHYLAPHGLEQYANGAWGTRDTCQGPVELLLARGDHEALRDLLLRVFRAQNPDGDWPQWFMFYDRERGIRASDSHGDIVFWPLLVLGQYLAVAEDGSVLDEKFPFFDHRGADQGEIAPLSLHAARALDVIAERVVAGTRLAAYGNGDWNDSLQPVDPAMKESLCSAWTVTLHYHTLRTLAAGLRRVGRGGETGGLDPDRIEHAAEDVLADYQRLLIEDGVLAGFACFVDAGRVERLLHPSDSVTGISYRLLPMIHSILYELFTPEQASDHVGYIREHLLAPDGARLFDRPPRYRGGLQQRFQRAESSPFFGREVGLMYTHAHLRYAEAMAHYGDAEAFFEALRRAHPIAIASVVPTAAVRQANCYYSSSDAVFHDRYEAGERYDDVKSGKVAVEGGWRIYSSGPGIAYRLIHECLVGVRRRASSVVFDPVLPPALDGLRADVRLAGAAVTMIFRTGRKGRGPLAVALNGQAVPFTREPNRYRTGGARVELDEIRSRLSSTENVLEISLE
jgi:cellobiose phosphorylase